MLITTNILIKTDALPVSQPDIFQKVTLP